MSENAKFYQGITAGFLAGIAVAAALRYTPFERFIANLSTVEGTVDGKLMALEEKLSGPTAAQGRFFSQREQSESAGDPRELLSARTGASAEFTRRGGAPGGKSEAEVLESPGRPGEMLNHRDVSQPVKASSRSLGLGGGIAG